MGSVDGRVTNKDKTVCRLCTKHLSYSTTTTNLRVRIAFVSFKICSNFIFGKTDRPSTLYCHAEEMRTICSETVNLQERVSNAEKSIALCLKNPQTYEAKIIEMEDRARRTKLLIFNLKEKAEGLNALCHI